MGTYAFREDQVISVEPYCCIPVIWQGIQIKHNIREYPKSICFYTFQHPENVIHRMKETGFQPSEDPPEDVKQNHRAHEVHQRYQSSPYRIGNAISFFVCLIVLALLDHVDVLFSGGNRLSIGSGTVSASALLAATCITTLLSSSFRKRYVLKEGREFYEIKAD